MKEKNDPAFKKRQKETASHYAVRSIQKAIREGELKIGDALPSEKELVERLGIGRSSVREGIRILETIGILEVRHGVGTYVVDNYVESLFRMLGFSLAGDNLWYFLAARRVLECGSIRLVCGSLSDDNLTELGKLAGNLSPQNGLEENIEIDYLFHSRLIQHTGNAMIIRIYSMIHTLLRELMEDLMGYEDICEDARTAHLEIVRSLRTRNPNDAEQAMGKHLERVEEYSKSRILQHIPESRQEQENQPSI
ncbi:MAG: FCD domain-containing protein [Eubacteriales bacterium]|nr:FCD domain-containing protein [Eubacteriales bacterium]